MVVLRRPITSATLGARKVLLRPIRPEDARPAFRFLHGRTAILRWLLWGGPRSERELEESFALWVRRADGGGAGGPGAPQEFLFAVVERERETFVGTLGLRRADAAGPVDIGYWLAEEVWGRGYATEAIALAAHFTFRHLGADALAAWVFVGNVASRRALEKNGFTLVRTAYDKVERDGKRRDEWYLVLLREEWEVDRADWRPDEEAVETE